MRTYLLKRLLLLPVTLFGVTLITFLLICLAPGDPASLKKHGMSEGAKAAAESARGSEDALAKWRARYRLDRPIHERYVLWLGDLARGDLGRTFFGDKDVWEEMRPHLAVSLALEAAALLLIFAVGIPLGIYSAWRPESVFDRMSSLVLFILYSLPTFWAATMLIVVFGNPETAPFGISFPVAGLRDVRLDGAGFWERAVDLAWHAFLPVLCLAYGTMAIVSRFMRAGLLEVVRQDFIRTARAKGLSERTVLLRHAVRNALFPIITLTAALLPVLVGGSIIVESIFSIPGMGWYAYDAILRREYNILMATFLLSAVVTLVGILVSDILYAVLDPRVSYDSRGGA